VTRTQGNIKAMETTKVERVGADRIAAKQRKRRRRGSAGLPSFGSGTAASQINPSQ
jgi:hypothetical protein